jgi:hypothetical protein
MHRVSGGKSEKEKVRARVFAFLNYLEENPGSIFVILFMILLTICAFLLAGRKEKAAESVANWAYLFLVIGVVIKLVEIKRLR